MDIYHGFIDSLAHALGYRRHSDAPRNATAHSRGVDLVTHRNALSRPTNAADDRIDALHEEDLPPNIIGESNFLKLPPEIRNRIYRFVLHHPDDIWITKDGGIPEPGLLSVSKQVRAEAYGVYYHENEFRCVVMYYDPATLLLARRKRDLAMAERYPVMGISSCALMMMLDDRNWDNLEAWLRACHKSQCNRLRGRHGRDRDAEMRAIEGLFEIVCTHTGMDDHTLDVLLKAMRPVLVDLNREWALDGAPDEGDL